MSPSVRSTLMSTIFMTLYLMGVFLTYGYEHASNHRFPVARAILFPVYWPVTGVYRLVVAVGDASTEIFRADRG
jgi:heme/copper-type cytochrome/quinol oxidase subunit 3